MSLTEAVIAKLQGKTCLDCVSAYKNHGVPTRTHTCESFTTLLGLHCAHHYKALFQIRVPIADAQTYQRIFVERAKQEGICPEFTVGDRDDYS